MWTAQWSDGTVVLYRDKPVVKMGGWSGDVVRIIKHSEGFHARDWRNSVREYKEGKV